MDIARTDSRLSRRGDARSAVARGRDSCCRSRTRTTNERIGGRGIGFRSARSGEAHRDVDDIESARAAQARDRRALPNRRHTGIHELAARVRARNRAIRRLLPGSYRQRREDLANQRAGVSHSRAPGAVRRHASRCPERAHVLRVGSAVHRRHIRRRQALVANARPELRVGGGPKRIKRSSRSPRTRRLAAHRRPCLST